MKKREEELEDAINEINDETSEEDQKTVEILVAEFENDQKHLRRRKMNMFLKREKLEDEIQKLQKSLTSQRQSHKCRK